MSESNEVAAMKAMQETLSHDLAILGKMLRRIEEHSRAPRFYFHRRVPLATHAVWYSVLIPKGIVRKIVINAVPATSTLLIGFGATDNLQETPPDQNYRTLATGSTNSKGYPYEILGSPPKDCSVLFLQSSADSTVAEVEIWD
jgi:hypothetical protein